MTDETTMLARQLLADSQVWGSACEAGIRSGSFDMGDLIIPYKMEAQKQLIRNRAELIEGDALDPVGDEVEAE